MEQAGQAKSLTGQVLMQDLATALDGHGGINNIISNSDYTLTFVLADETEITTEPVRGEKGDKGDRGTDGRAIKSVDLTSTSGLVDTYTVSFSDNTKTTFEVTNGSDIQSIAKTSTSGLVDTYTVTLTNGSTTKFTVTNGNGIKSITLSSGTHTPGTSDVYQITFDNGEYTTFSVYNGMNGTGAVSSVNTKTPDASGNVAITGADIPISEDNGESILEQFNSLGEHVENSISAMASDIDSVGSTVNDINNNLNAAIDDLASRVGEVDDGAVDSAAKLADGVVTRAKLATDALYSPSAWFSTAARDITADDIGKTIVADYSIRQSSPVLTLTAANNSAIPRGAEIAILQWYPDANNTPLTITFEKGIRFVDGNDETQYWNTDADGSFKMASGYSIIALKKLLDTAWLITGNVEVVT